MMQNVFRKLEENEATLVAESQDDTEETVSEGKRKSCLKAASMNYGKFLLFSFLSTFPIKFFN